MARLLLAGYFGCGNLGDDAILLGIVEGLHSQGHDITVLSGSPEETYRLYGFHCIARREMKLVKNAIASCDALVFPGGSIFQDVTSVRSVYYYSSLVTEAKKLRKKVIMVGQGVGPLTRFMGKRWASAAFNAADVIVVRDPASASALTKLGVKRKVQLAADPAFLLPQFEAKDDSTDYKVGDMKTVGLAPRPIGGSNKATIELFGGLARLLFQANMMPVLIEMDRVNDGPLIQAIGKQQGGKMPDMRKINSPLEIQKRMSRMDAVIAMRLHAGILAATVGIAPYMVNYDPKVAAFSKLLELNMAPDLASLTPQRLFDGFMTFQKSRERNTASVLAKQQELIKLARINVDAILSAL